MNKNRLQQGHPHINRQQYQDDSSDSEADSDSVNPQPQQLIAKEYERIKHQLKQVPYELIIKQMNSKSGSTGKEKQSTQTKKLAKKIKKVNVKVQKEFKGEAVEVSIHQRPKKKSAPIFQPQRKNIDPRFQTYAGHYNSDLARKSYNFIPKLQQAQISQLKSKLKNPTKRNKVNTYQHEILSKEYNRLTNDFKRVQLAQLQQKTKKQLRMSHGQNYYVGKQQFKQQFQKNKLQGMSKQDREKKIGEKVKQVQRKQINERHKALHFKPK